MKSKSAHSPRVSSSPAPSAARSGGIGNAARAARIRSVRDAAGLKQALSTARPGETIALADGRYRGQFGLSRSGTQEQPIRVEGSPKAILDGGKKGYTLHVEASHVHLDGFSIRGGKKALMLDGASNNELSNLDVGESQEEAIHFRHGSSDNILRDSHIYDAGRGRPEVGEGIYIGSDHKKDGGKPDRSNNNQILHNHVEGTRAEAIDVKENTKGTRIEGNILDGSEIQGKNGAETIVDLKGNGATVTGNHFSSQSGHNPHLDGAWELTPGRVPGAGTGNSVSQNTGLGEGNGVAPGAGPRPRDRQGNSASKPSTAKERWVEARTRMATALFGPSGEELEPIEKGEVLRVNEKSRQKRTIDGQEQQAERAMPAEHYGLKHQLKGWIPLRALKSSTATGNSGTTQGPSTTTGDQGTSTGPSSTGGSAPTVGKDSATAQKGAKQLPPAVLQLLGKASGGITDPEVWSNIMSLTGKAEHDKVEWWETAKGGSLYGYAEQLKLDTNDRGLTVGMGFTTHSSGRPTGDAQQLFQRFQELGGENLAPLSKNADRKGQAKELIQKIEALGHDELWIKAQWMEYIETCIKPAMKALSTAGFSHPKPLTLAALIDTCINHGAEGAKGANAIAKAVPRGLSEEAWLKAFVEKRTPVAWKGTDGGSRLNDEDNGKKRSEQYATMLNLGAMDLKSCDKALKKATSWEME